ncbi:hypothetical protein GQ457_18G018580 [Hibiscus cannabinus]
MQNNLQLTNVEQRPKSWNGIEWGSTRNDFHDSYGKKEEDEDEEGTDGPILCPSNNNAVVSIKPTVGLTSRAGVIPITPRQDTVGPMCITVADAAYVLDAIAGLDYHDKATIEASKNIPRGGYKQFLNIDENVNPTKYLEPYITNIDYEGLAMTAEFKLAINSYLKELVASPVQSLKDLIAFNNKYLKAVRKTKEYGQKHFLDAEATKGIGKKENEAILKLAKMSRDGFEKLMREHKLDALLSPFSSTAFILARGQYPGIIVPAGYDTVGLPFGLCFGGLKGTKPTLIEIAYAFEQATKIRKPRSFKH